MSARLLALAREFAEGKRDAADFVDPYISLWKQERDEGLLVLDVEQLSEVLSTIFCLADMFNPDPGRAAYEFDEPRLRDEVRRRISSLAPIDTR